MLPYFFSPFYIYEIMWYEKQKATRFSYKRVGSFSINEDHEAHLKNV